MLVFLIILLCGTLYTVPGLIALARRHSAWQRVWLVDVLFGFTVVGWLWALRDALRRDAVPGHKAYYRYSYYGEETRKTRFHLHQLPGTGDVGLAVGGLAVVALVGTLAWPYLAPKPATAIAAAAAAVSTPQRWTYSQEGDDRGAVRVSTLMSDDADAAEDRIPAALIVRQGPGGVSAAIRIDGQFTCSAASGGMIAAQFDGGKVESLACARRPDDEPQLTASGEDTLFIADPEAFVARVRSAHSLVLSADVLNEGVRHVQFSPQGLDPALAGLTAIPAATARAATVEAAEPAATEGEARPVLATLHKPSRPAHPARYKSWHE